MRLLFLDSENTCLSAAAEVITRGLASQWGMNDIFAMSAGTHVVRGGSCPHSNILRGVHHMPRQLTPDLLEGATLVLTARRSHQRMVTVMDPPARSKMYTIRQAGTFSSWLLEQQVVGIAVERAVGMERQGATYGMALHQTVSPMPQGETSRTEWLIEELESCRGLVGNRSAARHDFDLPNPDRQSRYSHAYAEGLLQAEIEALLRLVWTVRAAP